MPTEFDTYPLSAAVGTEISGLDLSQPLDAKTIRQLKDVLQDRHLLLFRAQDLSPDQQAQFARHFGDTSQRELNKESAENDDNQYVSNVRADGIFGKGKLDFHIDQLFLEDPLKALILYAVEIPASGGGTKFLNTESVYDAMPDSLKDRLRGLRCRHARAYDKKTTADWNVVDAEEESPSWVHPLLRRNPSTGKTAIWVNKLTTIGIEDMEPNASATLIDEVRSHFYDEGLAYSHAWRSGDLILWDNLVLQHARLPFDENSRRTLRRTAIL